MMRAFVDLRWIRWVPVTSIPVERRFVKARYRRADMEGL